MQTTLRRFGLLLLVLALLCGTGFALESELSTNEAVITSLDAVYTVSSDGSCAVSQTVSLRLPEGVSEYTLPLPAEARELVVSGGSFRLGKDGNTRFVTLEAPAQLQEQTIVLSYLLPGAVDANESEQRFTLKLLLPTRACAIEQYSATIALPAAFEGLPLFESGYYGDLIENYLDISIDDGTISLVSAQPLRDHESLTMSLTLPAGYFDLRFLSGKTVTVDLVLFWALIVLAFVYWLLFLRNRLVLPRSQAMPPLSGNAGAVPYLLTGDTPDLALMVMHWASLGYLTLTRTRRGTVRLEKLIDMGNERKGYEIRLFSELFGRGIDGAAPSERFRSVRHATPPAAKSFWESKLYLARAGKPEILRMLGAAAGVALHLIVFDRVIPAQSWRWFLIVPLAPLGGLACWLLQPAATCFLHRKPGKTLTLAALSLVFVLVCGRIAGLGALPFVCVLAQLLIGVGLLHGGRRSKNGLRHAEALLGLRRHLRKESPEALQQLLQDDPQYYYRTLPYADALRVGGCFTAKFRGAALEPCTWLTTEGRPPRDAEEFRRLYLGVLDILREQTDSPVGNLVYNLRKRSGAGKKEA